MELIKTSEEIRRSFDAQGDTSERINSIQLTITDDEGKTVGQACVYQNSVNAHLDLGGFSTIDEGLAKLREIFGVEA